LRTITTSFIDADEAELFGWAEGLAVDPRLRKTNGTLRQGILPSLLRSRKINQDAGNESVHLFELSAVFPPAATGDSAEALPAEYIQLALLADGSLADIRGAVEAVVRRFNPSATLQSRPAEAPGFAPGEAAELVLVGPDAPDGVFGVMGRVDANVADYYSLITQPAAAMVCFDSLLAMGQATRTYQPVPRFPAIRRDLSVSSMKRLPGNPSWQPRLPSPAT